MLELNKLYLLDCMEGMKEFPDGFFKLALPDPPYFSGPEKRGYYGADVNKLNIKRINYNKGTTWQIPDQSFFDELYRVSKDQIIFGCNYFKTIYPGTGRIIWDKCNDSSSFSDAEIAYCSLISSTRIFRYMWNGMMQGKSISEGHIMQGNKSLNEKKIHPTQKPVPLYVWQLKTFAKPGDIILITHSGSGSAEIACEQMGFEWISFETDKHNFEAASKRIEDYKNQPKLSFEAKPEHKQMTII